MLSCHQKLFLSPKIVFTFILVIYLEKSMSLTNSPIQRAEAGLGKLNIVLRLCVQEWPDRYPFVVK